MSSHAAHSEHHSTANEEKPHHGHVTPLWIYWGIWAALMVLTIITVGVAFIPIPALHVPMAIGIATIKATLVGLFFMHLLYDERFNLMLLLCVMGVVLIFLGFTMIDPLKRGETDSIQRRAIKAEMGPIPGSPAALAMASTTATTTTEGHAPAH